MPASLSRKDQSRQVRGHEGVAWTSTNASRKYNRGVAAPPSNELQQPQPLNSEKLHPLYLLGWPVFFPMWLSRLQMVMQGTYSFMHTWCWIWQKKKKTRWEGCGVLEYAKTFHEQMACSHPTNTRRELNPSLLAFSILTPDAAWARPTMHLVLIMPGA